MTDRPILFSAPMILALLDGRKTQTRRLISPTDDMLRPGDLVVSFRSGFGVRECSSFRPRIAVGDRLWVREAWRGDAQLDGIPPSDFSRGEPILYEADREIRWAGCLMISAGRLRASMHMPRWASRITLVVTDVRVQRLQECSPEDAVAEGIEKVFYDGDNPAFAGQFGWKDYRAGHPHSVVPFNDPLLSYASLWNAINGPEAWAANPWVVAYSFKVLLGNIDSRAVPA